MKDEMKTNIEQCPLCGTGTLSEKDDHSYSFKYGRKQYVVSGLLHSVCNECGTSMFLPKQLDSNYSKVQTCQQGIPDFISPAQILQLREIYNITQTQANAIFGGGQNAFSKYERGITSPTTATARNMLIALEDSTFMIAFAKRHGVIIKENNVAAHSNERVIDLIPKSIRHEVEQYAASVKLSLQDSCVALLRKGLDEVNSPLQNKAQSASKVIQRIDRRYVIDYRFKHFTELTLDDSFGAVTNVELSPVVMKRQKDHSKC